MRSCRDAVYALCERQNYETRQIFADAPSDVVDYCTGFQVTLVTYCTTQAKYKGAISEAAGQPV